MSWLPRGIPLSEETWRSRHGMLSGFLWLHVPVLFVIALVNGAGLAHSAVEVSPVVVLAGIARIARTRAWCEAAVSLGLLTCTYVLIHITGGVTEAHFHFFIALPAVAFYQRWMPYLLALGTVVVHHFTMSAVAPELIFGHPAAISRPVVWTLIHAVFVIIAAGVMVVFWGQIEAAQVQVSELHQHEAAAQRLRPRMRLSRSRTSANVWRGSPRTPRRPPRASAPSRHRSKRCRSASARWQVAPPMSRMWRTLRSSAHR